MKSELECKKCDFKADTLTMFLVHLSKKHNAGSNRKLRCRECDISFTNEKDLMTYITSVHIIPDNFSCTKCEFKSSKQFDLSLHMSTTHSEKSNTFSGFTKRKAV